MRRALPISAFVIQIVAACGASPPGGAQVDRASPGRDLPLTVAASARASCSEPGAGPLASAERDAAVAAFIQGNLRLATEKLEARVKAAPNDLAAQALLVASRTRADLAGKRAAREIERLDVKRLAALPGSFVTVAPLRPATAGAPIQVERVSDTPVAVLASTEAWMKKHGLVERTRFPRPEDLPDGAPQALGARANRLFSHADHEIVRYGSILLVTGPGRAPLVFDASGLHEIQFAQVVGRALLIASWRNGYAKDAGGRTGQIAAYSLDDGALLWASEPLVTSMGGFVVTRDHVISGYGFTAEPDHLFALELATGKTVQKLTLRSGPEIILQRGDRVFVRTYDSEGVFKITPEPGASPPAELPAAATTRSLLSADAQCWVRAAVSAIDARDPKRLASAIDALRAGAADPDVAGAFDGVQLFLEQQSTAAAAIDLTTITARRLPAPPWVYKLGRAATAPVTAKPRLVQRASAVADPVRSLARRGARVDPSQPFFLAPVDRGQLPPGARPDIPSTYGLETLRAVSPCKDDRLVLIYGGRYVAIVKGSTAEAVFDLETWLVPPRVVGDAQFAVSEATFAVVEGGVLYLANGGGSYASEMGGSKGYMSAIDVATGELLWRSQPLVMGPGTFGVTDGFLVTGYGFTAEPDNLFLLRKDTGQVVAKLPLKSAPDAITVDGDRVHVETYDATVTAEIAR